MASKFDQFLNDNKIDPRRLLATSHRIEQLHREDRELKLKKKQGKLEAAGEGEEQKPPPKPRSGRPVTRRLLQDVSAGKPVSGAAKTRLLRAVNHVLQQKKKDPVELKALF
jgi:hypothetical protein